MSALKIIFAGTPAFAVPALQALLQAGHQLCAVYTQPDRPAKRGQQLLPSPVKLAALAADIAVFQPLSLKALAVQEQLRACDADLMVVAAYGQILPQAVLDIPRLGCINIHASLLPRWRGAAPIQRAIAAGDAETGVCIMQMAVGLDTGDIWTVAHTPIDEQVNAGQLHDTLAQLGAQTLLQALPDITGGQLQAVPQSETGITYAHKLIKAESQVDWQRSAYDIACMVRAFNPWPMAHAHFKGTVIKIGMATTITSSQTSSVAAGTIVCNERATDDIWVQTGEGILAISQLQLPNKKMLPAAVVRHGYRELQIGQCFS